MHKSINHQHTSMCFESIINVFLPSSLFSPSVALMHFLTTGLISAQCPCLLIVRRRVLCLSNTAEFVFLTGKLKAHTHFHSRKSYQPLSKTFSAPLNPLFLILIYAYINECNLSGIIFFFFFLADTVRSLPISKSFVPNQNLSSAVPLL